MDFAAESGKERVKSRRIRVRRDDFVYTCARVAAKSALCFGKEGMARLLEAPDYEAALKVLSDAGFVVRRKEEEGDDIEGALDMYLERSFSDIFTSISLSADAGADTDVCVTGVFDFLRYPYDCHNVKSVLKSRIRPCEVSELFIPLGTVNEQSLVAMASKNDFSGLPLHMADAASRIPGEFAASSDPRVIDTLMDRACFADMCDAVSRCNVPAFKRIVAVKCDLVNIMTFIRLSRMRALFSFASLTDELVEGGSIPLSLFTEALKDENCLVKRLLSGIYAPLADFNVKKAHEAEKTADNIYLSVVKSECYKDSYGPEMIAAFITAREYEVKNIRIVVAAKKAGVSAVQIKERLRDML